MNGSYTTIDVPGAFQTNLSGINNSGQIVEVYRDAHGLSHGFLATPTGASVPEPAGLLLLGIARSA